MGDEKERENAEGSEEEEKQDIEEELYFLEDVEEEDVLDELPPESTKTHPPPDPACITTPPLKWSSQHTPPDLSGHFQCGEDFLIKNISALFSHTANETVAKLMSFQDSTISNITQEAPPSFLRVLGVIKRLSKFQLGSFVSSTWQWGVSNAMQDYAFAKGEKGAKQTITSQGLAGMGLDGSEVKRVLVINYVTAETILFLLSNSPNFLALPPSLAFSGEVLDGPGGWKSSGSVDENSIPPNVIKSMEEFALQFHTIPHLSHSKVASEMVLDARVRYLWAHLIGKLAERGRLDQIYHHFNQTVVANPKDNFSGLIRSVSFLQFPVAGARGLALVGQVCDEFVTNFKPLVGKSSKQRDAIFTVLLGWITSVTTADDEGLSPSLDKSVSVLLERVMKYYKKGKFLEGTIALASLTCLRLRLLKSDEKLKSNLTPYVSTIVSAVKSNTSRSLALEGIFRLLVSKSLSTDEMKTLIWTPLLNFLIPNKDKFSSHPPSLNVLVDIITVMMSQDPNAAVTDVLLPLLEPPFAPEIFMAAAFGFLRLWELLPDSEHIRHVGVLKKWNAVSVALGVNSFPHHDDLDYLAIQRKQIIDTFLKGSLHVTNLVLHIGKLNRTLCTLFESHAGVVSHITTNTNLGKAPDVLSINTMVVMLLCFRITIPVHIPRQQWLSSMCKMTQHTNAHIRSCSVDALRDVILHYPDLRISLLKELITYIVEISVTKIDGIVSLLSLASLLIRLWTAEVENGNQNERKPSLAGELNVEREIELTSEEFDAPLLPLLCHWDTRVRKAVLTVFRCYVSLSDSLNRESERKRQEGEESEGEEEWIREVLDENEEDFMQSAMVNRTIPSATTTYDTRTIEECATDKEDKWLWTRVVGEIFSCLARRASTTVEEAARPLHKHLQAMFPQHEKPKVVTDEEQARMKMWGALLSALTASAGCLKEEEGGDGGESATQLNLRTVLDTLWMCLFSDRREIRVAAEFAFTFLPKDTFLTLVDDMEEFQDASSALLLKLTGKKSILPQQQAYATTYLWRILSHNMRGKRVFFSTAYKSLREKALKHLATYSSCSSLMIDPAHDPRMALRIRYNTCCWVKNMSEEVLDVSKTALIEFDTLKIFGPELHESCFRYLLDTSLAGANRQEISTADNASLSHFLLKKKGLSEDELHRDYEKYKKSVVFKALQTLSPLLKLDSMPDNYVFPFVDFLGNIFSQNNEQHIKLVKVPTSYFLLPVPPQDLEKIARGCLERSYVEDIPTAAGHLAFLSRVLELRKSDVKFPLPIAINAILYKLGQSSPILRKQAVGLMRTMAGSEHFTRYYIAGWECMSPLVYRRLQSTLSQEFAVDYKEHTLAVWSEAYERLGRVPSTDRHHILRLMSPWLGNFEFDRMLSKESTKVMDDLIVISHKFSEVFPKETDRFWEVVAQTKETNVKILVNHMLKIAARDRNTDMYNVCLYGWSHIIRLCPPSVIRPLFTAALDIDLAVDMGEKSGDWDFAFNQMRKRSLEAEENERKKERERAKKEAEEMEDPVRRQSSVKAMARFDSTPIKRGQKNPQPAAIGKREEKEKEEKDVPEVWSQKECLPFKEISNPLSLSDIACCSFADLILENPDSLLSSTPFVFVIAVLGMDHPNRFVWQNSNRLMANLIQSVTLPHRPNDEGVLKIIRQLNLSKQGLWERQRAGRDEMRMTSVNRLRECVERVVVVLESEWKGEGLRRQIASEALGVAQKLHARSPHLAGRCLQIHRALFSEDLEVHVQPLLCLWNQNFVERKPKDFAVSFDVMMNLMTFLDLFDDNGQNSSGGNLSQYGEVFWAGIAALFSCEEKEVFVALMLLRKLLDKFGFKSGGSRDDRTEAVIKSAPSSNWQPPFQGICPIVWKGLTSSVTVVSAFSLLLKLSKIPHFSQLQGDNHILYYIGGFGAFLTMELLECHHVSRVHKVKRFSKEMQEAIESLVALCKGSHSAISTALSNILNLPFCQPEPDSDDESNSNPPSLPLPTLHDCLGLIRGVGRAVAGSFFPEYDGVLFSLLRELISSGPKEAQGGSIIFLASLFEASTKDSKEGRSISASVLAAPLSHMHDRADLEEEEDGFLIDPSLEFGVEDLHVGVDFLVDGVTRAFVRNEGTINFDSFQIKPSVQALMGDLTSPSYAWSSFEFSRFFVSTSMSVSLRSYKETPPAPLSSLSPLSPSSPNPLSPSGPVAPATEKFHVAEGKKIYCAKLPSDPSSSGDSFATSTYFTTAAPVRPSVPRQRSGFGSRLSRVVPENATEASGSGSSNPPTLAPLRNSTSSFNTTSPLPPPLSSSPRGSVGASRGPAPSPGSARGPAPSAPPSPTGRPPSQSARGPPPSRTPAPPSQSARGPPPSRNPAPPPRMGSFQKPSPPSLPSPK